MTRRARTGSFLAAAALVCGILLVSLIALFTQGGGDFNQHVVAVHGTRAILYGRAALKEAGLALERKLATAAGRDALAGGNWAELVATIEAQLADNLSAPATGEIRLQSVADLAPRAQAMAAAGGAKLIELTLSLRGFRRIGVGTLGVPLDKVAAYYFDQNLDGIGPPDPPLRAYSGFAVLTATVAFEGPRLFTSRRVTAQQLLKIAPSAPPGREFALSLWGDTRGATEQFKDLNSGGSLHVFGNRDGRIFLRGPYEIKSVGYPPLVCSDNPTTHPNGGEHPAPQITTSFLPPGRIDPDTFKSMDPYQWVDCWGLMPAPRAGVVEQCGPLLLRVNTQLFPLHAQVRPQRWAVFGAPSCPDPPQNLGEFIGALIGGIGMLLGAVVNALGCISTPLNPFVLLDACFYKGLMNNDWGAVIQPGQWWFIEYGKVPSASIGTRQVRDYFSIAGATMPDPSGRIRVSPYRGWLHKDTRSGDTLFEPVAEYRQPPEKFDELLRPGDLGGSSESRYVVPVEGVADVLVHREVHNAPLICPHNYTDAIDAGPDPANPTAGAPPPGELKAEEQYTAYKMPYGLYWAPHEYADLRAAFWGDLIGLGLTVVGGFAGAGLGHGAGSILGRVVGGSFAGWAAGTIAGNVAGAWSQEKPGTYGADDAPAADLYRFPPGYGYPGRLATRRYATLADYPGLWTHERSAAVPEDHDILVLDGPIFVEKLSHDRPIQYVGRGWIVTDDTDEPKLTAPIVSAHLSSQEFDGDPATYGVLGREEPFRGYAEPQPGGDALVIYLRGDEKQPHEAKGQLIVDVKDSFGKSFDYDSPAPVHASIVSLQGVRPKETGQAVRIVGNLVAYFGNRRHLPPASKLEVLYRRPLPPEPDMATLSPVWSGYGGEVEP